MFCLALQCLIAFRLGYAERGLADLLILHPPSHAVDTRGLDRRWVATTAGRIEVWVAASPGARANGGPSAFVLEFTGNGNSAESVTRWVADGIWKHRPVEVWGVNYPGYGGSDGPATLASIPRAALAAFDHLKKDAGDRPIFVSGASLGGMTAVYVAANRPVAGVMVLNPPALREVIVGRYGWWNLWLLAVVVAAEIPAELDTIANAARCTAPLFAVVSNDDEVVPAKIQGRIFTQYRGPKSVFTMDGATHGSNVSEEADRMRQRWIDQRWRETIR